MPTFAGTDFKRYTQRPFPPYRYLPFQGDRSHPHPRNDAAGHSYNEEEVYLSHFSESSWHNCDSYLFGIDLFNYGYWWESHEALEAVWLAAGQRSTRCGRFVQGLIQLAGAQLKRYINEPCGAQSLTRAGCEKLAAVGGLFLGVDVASLVSDAQRLLVEDRGEYPRIDLHFTNGKTADQEMMI